MLSNCIFIGNITFLKMVTQITKGIQITVITSYEGTYFRNYKLLYAFNYQITIENKSKDTVQLNSRHWEILDALNHKEIVDGEGVVGKKPVIQPGNSYTYTSGCLLNAPIGAMKGYFNMVTLSNAIHFRVYVPTFKLSSAFALN